MRPYVKQESTVCVTQTTNLDFGALSVDWSDILLCRLSQQEKMRKEMRKRGSSAMEKTEGMGTARMDFIMFRSDLLIYENQSD